MLENLVKKYQISEILLNIWNNGDTLGIITNKDCLVKLLNPFAEKYLDYQSNEIVDKLNIDELFDNDELLFIAKSQIKDFENKYQNTNCLIAIISEFGLEHEIELNMIRKDGTKFPVILKIFHSFNHDECFVLTANLNISKKFSELNTIDKHLLELLEKEKQLNEVRKHYLNIASHEFRTPLSIILSSAFILSKFEKTEEQCHREEQIKHIISAVNFLRDIINDFLTLNKIDEGQLEIKKAYFDVKEQISEIIGDLNVVLKKGQIITFKHSGKTDLLSDSNAFKHLLINILSNAIKFSPENAKIIVKSNLEDKFYKLSVKDHGFGISKEDQKKLFSPFFRGKNAKEIQGTGLGLHIVQYYLNRMNGNIRIKSKVDNGTTIEITLNDLDKQENPKDT